MCVCVCECVLYPLSEQPNLLVGSFSSSPVNSSDTLGEKDDGIVTS